MYEDSLANKLIVLKRLLATDLYNIAIRIKNFIRYYRSWVLRTVPNTGRKLVLENVISLLVDRTMFSVLVPSVVMKVIYTKRKYSWKYGNWFRCSNLMSDTTETNCWLLLLRSIYYYEICFLHLNRNRMIV